MFRKIIVALFVVVDAGCNPVVSPELNLNIPRVVAGPETDTETADGRTRNFKFVYGATLTDLEPGADVRVWLPVATSNHDQDVELLSTRLPGSYRRTVETKYGNQLIYFEAKANAQGEVPIEVTYRVTRRELTKNNYESAVDSGTTFLQASSLVPTGDELRKEVLGDAIPSSEPVLAARQLYDGVGTHMKYDKPEEKLGWGNGDAEWACQNGFGNCTDFHSLFISSARNLKIPARFEIGFSIPARIGAGVVGGYHCWAKFLADEKWVPVDISEGDKHPEMKEYYFGNLTPDRVTFSIGRDLELQPAPAMGTVNYLSYPYAEVDGKQHKSFRKAFRYEDISSDR